MLTLPCAKEVIRPVVEFTMAILIEPELHITFLMVAFDGDTVASICKVSPTKIVSSPEVTATDWGEVSVSFTYALSQLNASRSVPLEFTRYAPSFVLHRP